MALIELEKQFILYLEPLKQRVEDRFDELSAIVKQTTLSLSHWDTETEQSVSSLHQARDEQVIPFYQNSQRLLTLMVELNLFGHEHISRRFSIRTSTA